MNVKRIVQHPQFNYGTIDYDYSLLELEEALPFSESIGSIALPKASDDARVGTLCIVSGWGNTQSISESRTNLRSAIVPIVDQQTCYDAYAGYGGITDRMLCAGFTKGGKDGERL